MQRAVVLGSFDGIHLGHQAVLNAASGYELIAVTFDIPPKLCRSNSPFLLLNTEEKERLLKKYGVQRIVSLSFNDVKNESADIFLQRIMKEFSPSLIVCGYNYRFGKDALGDTELIKSFCKKNGIDFKLVPCVYKCDVAVSSSLIRELLINGDIAKANELLGRAFSFAAVITEGDKRGRTIGFPTINQAYPSELLIPKLGVYESECLIENKAYKAISNLGFRPTYKTEKVFCETHIIGFSGNLYGKTAKIKLLRFIREEKRFSSLDELKGAINSDISGIL